MQRPPAYQILHCMKNEVSGGTSSFVDGFMVANTLKERRVQAHKQLLRWQIPFQYVNDGHEFHAEHPTIVLNTDTEKPMEINYSPPFQAPFPTKWERPVYNSLHRFAHLVDDKLFHFRHAMKPGDCVIFNNRRILHARDAFDDQEGERWLRGCYLTMDDVLAKWRKFGTVPDDELGPY